MLRRSMGLGRGSAGACAVDAAPCTPQAAQEQLQSERTRAQSVLKELEACQSGRVLLQDAINNHHNVLQGEVGWAGISVCSHRVPRQVW